MKLIIVLSRLGLLQVHATFGEALKALLKKISSFRARQQIERVKTVSRFEKTSKSNLEQTFLFKVAVA